MLGCLKYDHFFAVVILEMLRRSRYYTAVFLFLPFFAFTFIYNFFTTTRKLLAGIRDVTNDAIVHASHFDRIEGAFTAIPLL